MHSSKSILAKSVFKYLLVFVLGLVCGGGLVFQFGWNMLFDLMGSKAQFEYQAADTSTDAYFLTGVLCHLRLGEVEKATQTAEWLLDEQTIKAATLAKDSKNAKVRKVRDTNLGLIKRYRQIYPSQTEFKSQVNKILKSVPSLPEPKRKLPENKLSVTWAFISTTPKPIRIIGPAKLHAKTMKLSRAL